MQNGSPVPALSLPFSPSETLSLPTDALILSLRRNDHPQAVFEWLSLRVRYRQRWAELHVTNLLPSPHGAALQFTCRKHAHITAELTLQIHDQLLTASLDCPSAGVEALSLDLTAQPGEHFLGFGERFNRIDQRGQEVDLYVTNGASGGLAYKPVPFFMSSAGYAFRLLTTIRTKIRLACLDDPGVVSIRTESKQLSFQLWSGEPFAGLLQRYARLLGLPLYRPPGWIFGPWKSRDWTSDDYKATLQDLHLPRELKLAGTVKLIDAAWESDLNDFLFNKKYPNPEELIAEVRRLGYRLVLWISPWMVKASPDTPIYEFCAANGFLIKNREGQPYVHRLGNSPDFMGSCFDFTNPAALAWWQEQIERLVKLGVDGFKTDFGEQVPDDALFFDGRSGREVHNLFPLLYNRATYEAMNRHTQGVLLARSAWDGSQRYCAAWGGDQSADFGPATGLPSVILAGQNAGLSAFACWGSDIGGYFGQPTEDIFARWIAFGAFSPIMQLHGLGCREPWDFSLRILEIYRFYSHLHLDLFPYIYTFAQAASESGMPIMRAMALSFPHDPKIWDAMVEFQYMFGTELLVAPIYFGHSSKRQVYLPAGLWYDFWNGESYEGNREWTVRAALDQIPVFARAGAIIPMLDSCPETLVPSEDPQIKSAGEDLRLFVFPGADGCFELHDGSRFTWDQASQTLSIQNTASPRWISARLMGSQIPFSAASGPDGHSIPVFTTSLNNKQRYIRIRVDTSAEYKIR